MPANFDGTSAELQPNKNSEDINNRKNKKNTSNEEQWTFMVNNKRKNIQRPLMENLYIGNLTNDTTEEEIFTLLGLDGNTYLHENSLARRLYTDNGTFAGYIHVWMP